MPAFIARTPTAPRPPGFPRAAQDQADGAGNGHDGPLHEACRGEIGSQVVDVDASLIDMEGQMPEWTRLDLKAKDVIIRVFENLPA